MKKFISFVLLFLCQIAYANSQQYRTPIQILKSQLTEPPPEECTSEGPQSTCVKVGYFRPGSTNIVVSHDGGKSYKLQDVDGFLDSEGWLTALSCTDKGESAFCVAAGNYNDLGVYPYGSGVIVQSNGLNKHWVAINHLKDTHENVYYNTMNCVGSGNDAVCMSVVFDNDVPVIVSTSDRGKNWKVTRFPEVNPDGEFPWVQSASCSGEGVTARCYTKFYLIASDMPRIYRPFEVITSDGARTFHINVLPHEFDN